MNPEAMILNTAGINAVSKALNAANSAAASNKSGPKYKKAPDAPKRFKSAFIIYSAEKHREIKEDLISQGRTEKVRWMMIDDYCIYFVRCFIVHRVGGSCCGRRYPNPLPLNSCLPSFVYSFWLIFV